MAAYIFDLGGARLLALLSCDIISNEAKYHISHEKNLGRLTFHIGNQCQQALAITFT